jgi:SAM-dependent methyltransferase
VASFSGPVAECYAQFRRGYPDSTVSGIVSRLGLAPDDIVVDLGCGTGLLTLPLARHIGLVVGVDPEPDMLAIARRCAAESGTANTAWLLGSDADLGILHRLLGGQALGAVTIAQALHWMNHERLFSEIRPLTRPGGGVVVIANGTPLWQQDSRPSRALRRAVEEWFGTGSGTSSCGTDSETRSRYASALAAARFEVTELVTEYNEELTVEQVVGGMFSAMSPEDLAEDRRAAFTAHIAQALPKDEPFVEVVRVATLIGIRE